MHVDKNLSRAAILNPGCILERTTWERFADTLTPSALFEKIDLIGLWQGGVPSIGVFVAFFQCPRDSNIQPELKLTL